MSQLTPITLDAYQARRTWSVPRWGALVEIALPEGVQRHPRVLEGLTSQIERSCVLDEEVTGIRLSFSTCGESLNEATDDCRHVTRHVLSILGLGPDAVLQQLIRDREHVDDGGPALHDLRSK